MLVCAVVLALVGGCGGGGGPADPGTSDRSPSSRGGERPPAETVVPSHCPPGLPSCRTTEGRIFYVERVDPDGDGDAHFVIADRQGITTPGATAIDVRRGLRPRPLPGIGDLISAAGPVQTGSYGQSQIHALELHVGSAGVSPTGRREGYHRRMCRNIKTLYNFDPPAKSQEIDDAALQYVRKISGFTKPSQANAEAFEEAVEAVAEISAKLLDRLVTSAPPKDREVEAAKRRARSEARFAA